MITHLNQPDDTEVLRLTEVRLPVDYEDDNTDKREGPTDMTNSPRIARLNHAVLWVADAEHAATFYVDVLGFVVAASIKGAVFLRAGGSSNDHDLGLFSIGSRPTPPRSIGLYHLAWQVDTLDELVAVRKRLSTANALVGASDHGVSKSLYGKDLDGIEFEILWSIPQSAWGDLEHGLKTAALDLDHELQRWSGHQTAADANWARSSP